MHYSYAAANKMNNSFLPIIAFFGNDDDIAFTATVRMSGGADLYCTYCMMLTAATRKFPET